jgi:predicted Rossmann fold nucleotide-binding protein DprA/Smf involved in DNA uptake
MDEETRPYVGVSVFPGIGPVRSVKIVTNSEIRTGTKEKQKISDCIGGRHMQIDELVRTSGLTISQASATLSILKLKGLVKGYGDKEYGIV